MRIFSVSFLLSILLTGFVSAEPHVTLQRLDGGRTWVGELNRFCDTFAYTGKSKGLVVSAYLVRHDNELMLWDTGLPAGTKGSQIDKSKPMSREMNKTLVEQLAELDVKPEDIDYVAISHYHADHIGQAGSFPQAKLLIGEDDWKRLSSDEQHPSLQRQYLEPWLKGGSEVQTVSGDHDVFGDGSVVFIDTPGHTPGHHSLLVKLQETGPVLLTGDVAHFKENLANNRVPTFNPNRADSLASMDRFRRIAQNLKALIIIQHEPDHVKRLPEFPGRAK